MQPFDGEIYTRSGPLKKWNGRHFGQLSDGDAVRYKATKPSAEPWYSDVGGWSSRINLLNQGNKRLEYPLDLNGAQAVVIADRSNERQPTLKVQIAQRGIVDILSVDEGFRTVNADEYSTLMRGPLLTQ